MTPELDVVGQALLLADAEEEAAAHAVAEDGVEDLERPASGWSRRRAGTPRHELGLRRVAARRARTRSPAGSAGAGLEARRRGPSPVPKASPTSSTASVVGDVARDRDDHVGRPVARPPRRRGWLAAGRPRTLSSLAGDLAAQRRVAEHRQVEERWTYSAGSSRYERISSTMTSRSRSISCVAQQRPDDQLAEHVHAARRFAQRAPGPSRRSIRGRSRR